jgi:hypothetical protein
VLSLVVTVHSLLLTWPDHLHHEREEGQATAEYALVLLGAAAIALLVFAWANDTNRISKLLDSVIDSLLSKVT